MTAPIEDPSALRRRVEALTEDLARATDALIATRAENAALSTRLEEVTAELAALRAQGETDRAALQTASDAGGASAQALATELAATRQERDAMLQSTSWRITAPLRRVIVRVLAVRRR